jgi:hypothetical protein
MLVRQWLITKHQDRVAIPSGLDRGDLFGCQRFGQIDAGYSSGEIPRMGYASAAKLGSLCRIQPLASTSVSPRRLDALVSLQQILHVGRMLFLDGQDTLQHHPG